MKFFDLTDTSKKVSIYSSKDKNTVPVGSPDAAKAVSNLPPWLSLLCKLGLKRRIY